MRPTGAVAELEAKVGASEAVDGDGQLEELGPPGAVVVVEDQGAVLRSAGLPGAQADAVLQDGKATSASWPQEDGAPRRSRPGRAPHLEDLSVGVDDVNCDFDVLLNALPSSLKVPPFQGEVQVVADVACKGEPGSGTLANMEASQEQEASLVAVGLGVASTCHSPGMMTSGMPSFRLTATPLLERAGFSRQSCSRSPRSSCREMRRPAGGSWLRTTSRTFWSCTGG